MKIEAIKENGNVVDISLHELEEKAWRDNGCRINGTWVNRARLIEAARHMAKQEQGYWHERKKISLYCEKYRELLNGEIDEDSPRT